MMRLSQAAAIPHSQIRAIASLAEAYPGTLRLFVGEDSRPTPDFIKAAAHAAIEADQTYYTPNAGTIEARQALSEHVLALHGIALDPRTRLIITASGMNAIVLAVQATLGPESSAIVVTPCWPNLSAAVAVTGATPIQVPLALDGDRYTLDFDRLTAAARPDTRLLALATPGNPTGWMATADDWTRLAAWCERHNVWLLVDSVYERIVFQGRVAPSPFAEPRLLERLIVVNSLSKAYRMTGWRVGWVAGPERLIQSMTGFQEFAVSCVAGVVQAAAIAAWRDGEAHIAESQARYAHQVELAIGRLQALPGLRCTRPDGGFYVFPGIDGLGESFAWCQRLVREYRLGLAPGSSFGAGGEGHVRFCVAVEEAILVEALERFTQGYLRWRDRSGDD
ncbi:MAG: aminotransferase [Isosphaeraceae bacterium]|jgi:aspartate/methionine/tyrosine aminotransferase|nr:MAG: aminotransferase [Isosphaeraceae bacterium]